MRQAVGIDKVEEGRIVSVPGDLAQNAAGNAITNS